MNRGPLPVYLEASPIFSLRVLEFYSRLRAFRHSIVVIAKREKVFTKKKIIAFIAACAVFLVLDIWMFSVLKSSYAKAILEDRKQLVLALAWLRQAKKDYPGIRLDYIEGIPGVEATSYLEVFVAALGPSVESFISTDYGEILV
jgi:hypothetical protein